MAKKSTEYRRVVSFLLTKEEDCEKFRDVFEEIAENYPHRFTSTELAKNRHAFDPILKNPCVIEKEGAEYFGWDEPLGYVIPGREDTACAVIHGTAILSSKQDLPAFLDSVNNEAKKAADRNKMHGEIIIIAQEERPYNPPYQRAGE